MDHKKRNRILENAAEAGSSLLTNRISRWNITEKLGVCTTCKHLAYFKTRLTDEAYWCRKYNGVRLKTSDPIEVCTKYWHVGWSDIWDLKELATLVDPPKRKIGFGNDDEEE